MDTDDIAPPPARDPLAMLARTDLEPLSVTELELRIATLEAEVARVRAHLATAGQRRAAADALFKR